MINIESVVFELWNCSEEEIIQEVMLRFSLGYSEAFEAVRKIITVEEEGDPGEYSEWQSFDPDC